LKRTINIIENSIQQILQTEDASNKTCKSLGNFSRYIDDNVIKENKDCYFANKVVTAYLEMGEWGFLSGALKQYKPNFTFLHEEINQVLDKLIQNLTVTVAYASITQWHMHVKERLYKGGAKMFNRISKEDKQYLHLQTDNHGAYKHSPGNRLEAQADEWESRWNSAAETTNKTIHILLNNIVQESYRCTEIDTHFGNGVVD